LSPGSERTPFAQSSSRHRGLAGLPCPAQKLFLESFSLALGAGLSEPVSLADGAELVMGGKRKAAARWQHSVTHHNSESTECGVHRQPCPGSLRPSASMASEGPGGDTCAFLEWSSLVSWAHSLDSAESGVGCRNSHCVVAAWTHTSESQGSQQLRLGFTHSYVLGHSGLGHRGFMRVIRIGHSCEPPQISDWCRIYNSTVTVPSEAISAVARDSSHIYQPW
jgi:hypothetical protein